MTSPVPPANRESIAPLEPLEVFFSYAHEDESYKDELVKNLKMLKRQNLIRDWHDRQISAGTEWKNAIDTHLETAAIILLLISSDFINSDYCWDKELKRAMERHEAGEARVIPIILRKCDWHEASFGKLQALPKNATPIKTWPDQDEAYLNVVEGLKKVITELTNHPLQGSR